MTPEDLVPKYLKPEEEADMRVRFRNVTRLSGKIGLLQAIGEMGACLQVAMDVLKECDAKEDPWHWPYMRHSDGPEYACQHMVGHSTGVHGCDGCCADPAFPGRKKQ